MAPSIAVQSDGSVLVAAPVLVQRYQIYVYVGSGKPDQVPVPTVKLLPTFAVPVIVGAAVRDGASVTRSVVAENETVEPTEFVAVTRTRRYFPASVAPGA